MTEISHSNFTLEACKPPPWNLLTLHNFNRTWFNLHNNIRTISRTQEHLQGNLHLQHLNATKRTYKISPKANPFVDRAILYFLQEISLILIKKCSQNRRNKIWEWEVWAEAEKEQREKKRSNGRVGRVGCRAGGADRDITCMQTCRIRRPRQGNFVSGGRDSFPRWADVARSSPLTPGSHDKSCRHAGPRLEFSNSHPPDRIGANRVRRLRRCASSEIS
jgi:hypothetical protein